MVETHIIRECMRAVLAENREGLPCREFLVKAAAKWGEDLTEARVDELCKNMGFKDGDRCAPGPSMQGTGTA